MANLFKNHGLTCTTSFSDLVVVPVDSQIVVHSLYLCNIDANEADGVANIQVYTSNGTFPLAPKLDVYAGSPVAFDKPINLEAGDKLQIKSNVDNRISAFISYLEVTP